MTKRIFHLIFALSFIFCLSAALFAQRELDISFGGTGKVVTSFTNSATSYKPLVQPDNKIIAVGIWNSPQPSSGSFFALVRYHTDGSVDTSFGDQGRVFTDFHVASWAIQGAWTAALQPDGKILAAGYASIIHPGNSFYAMARYNTDGSLDQTFGTGGKVVTQIETGQHEAYAIAIGSDGKIVLAGSFFATQTTQTLVARYNADGSLDTTFGGDGTVTDFRGFSPGDANTARAVAIQPDGKIVIGGSFGREPTVSGYDITVARFNTNGTYDNTFGDQGRLLIPSPQISEGIKAIVLQPDGRILAAGYSGPNNDFLVMRLLENGAQDITFSDDGRMTVPMGGAGANDLTLRPNGKILITGQAGFSLVSCNTDGTLDTSFSGDGKFTFGFEGTFTSGSYGLAIDGLGRPVLSGAAGTNFGVARLYTTDPVPVTVTGQTVTMEGTPLRNIRVGLTGQDGQTRWANTSPFGFFVFDNVPTGQTYTLFVRGSKHYSFETRTFGLNEAIDNLYLIGSPIQSRPGGDNIMLKKGKK
jgi:uncharacterized delta-60 repeat protein